MILAVDLIWILLSVLCNCQVLLPNCPHPPSYSLHSGQESPQICLTADKESLVHENYLHPSVPSVEVFKGVLNTIHSYFKLCRED